MVAVRTRESLRWLGPLPIWGRPTPVGLRIGSEVQAGQPAILRFDHDEFMEEYLATLNSEPERLGEWLARPETWRAPMASPRKASGEAGEPSSVAFLINKTRRLTEELKVARRGGAGRSINLRPLKNGAKRAVRAPERGEAPLKLFQSTHKRHYLVSASLISTEAGLPDCTPDIRRREKVGFVVRRLLPPPGAEAGEVALAQWDEYAFVAAAQGGRWHRVGAHGAATTEVVVPAEERLPLFPVGFSNSCRGERRLHTGVIPVNRREAWMGAPVEGGLAADGVAGVAAPQRPLAAALFQADVVAPWRMLLERAEVKKNAAARAFPNFDADAAALAEDLKRLRRTARDEIQTGSWYVLLDFARFLEAHLPAIWRVLTGEAVVETLADDEQALVALLNATRLPIDLAGAIVTYPLWYWSGGAGWLLRPPAAQPRYTWWHLKWTLAQALVAARAEEAGLEAVESLFTRYTDAGEPAEIDRNWPGFLFPLADPEFDAPIPALDDSELEALAGLERAQAALESLAAKVEALLAPDGGGSIDSVPPGDGREGWFVVRCVYERPNCGPLFPALVSAPTQPFQLAPFFDPDAPARPVRIPMPLDISPAGLRKYQKNTGFVISDMLCGKIKKIRQLSLGDLVLSVLPWPFHKDLPDMDKSGPCKDGGGVGLGMVCSLSIPIVTLCALILMMIVVALFDLVFRWIPYLFTCLPIPGLKGKKGEG